MAYLFCHQMSPGARALGKFEKMCARSKPCLEKGTSPKARRGLSFVSGRSNLSTPRDDYLGPMFVGFGNPVDLSWSICHKPEIFGSYSHLVFVSLFPATTRSLCATKSGPPTGSPCHLRSPGRLSAWRGFPEMSILNIPKPFSICF